MQSRVARRTLSVGLACLGEAIRHRAGVKTEALQTLLPCASLESRQRWLHAHNRREVKGARKFAGGDGIRPQKSGQ